ncbi:MAG: cysteine synthase A [Bacteroidales bacterium]|nr:cysteine synthase A [Bacteroidales bacterium]
MAKIHPSMLDLIGETPLVEVSNIMDMFNTKARILAKLESYNPGGSAKDRIALSMIETAEKDGSLKKGATIIEPTSGNTGIGLAWIASLKGYKCILTMPDSMSVERRNMLNALGAELVLTPGSQGMKGAIAKAEELQRQIPGSFIPRQFDNPANPMAHAVNTANEIWRDTDGIIDILVAGIGTGGTLCGSARTLKQLNPTLKAVAVEPADSPVLSGGHPGPHSIQGIGAGFIPKNYDPTVVDEIMTATGQDAINMAQLLARKEAIMAGFSSGAAMWAALKQALRAENENKTIVVILPDTGQRYLSTPLYAHE